MSTTHLPKQQASSDFYAEAAKALHFFSLDKNQYLCSGAKFEFAVKAKKFLIIV